MKTVHILLLTVIVAVAASWTTVKLAGLHDASSQTKIKETAYERILRTGKIRCGYYVFPPATQIDPNSGELSGLFVDMWDILAQNMSLEVEWTEELSFGNLYEGLTMGRYDAICTPDWPSARSARVALYSVPVFFSGINVYVRQDDTRFDDDFMILNDPAYALSVQDGSVGEQIGALRFPVAGTVGIARDAPAAQMELNVVNGKADATFLDHNRFMLFNEAHPGALKQVNDEPVRIYSFKIAVPAGDYKLKFWLDEAVEELLHNGEMDRLVDQWELFPDSFLRVALPYEAPEKSIEFAR